MTQNIGEETERHHGAAPESPASPPVVRWWAWTKGVLTVALAVILVHKISALLGGLDWTGLLPL